MRGLKALNHYSYSYKIPGVSQDNDCVLCAFLGFVLRFKPLLAIVEDQATVREH